MGPWLRAFSASRWKVEGDREKFADAWRRWVKEQFPVGRMLHLPQPPSVPPVRRAAPPAAAAKPAPKAVPKPPPKRSPPPQYGGYANIRYVLQHFGSDLATEHRGSKAINVCPWSRLDGAGFCTRPHSQEAAALLRHLWRVDPELSPAKVEDLRTALDQQLQQLETRVEELRGVLRSNRRRSIKDYWRGRVPDLQLRWTAIRGAINVVIYALSGLWSVRVRESEKVLLEASDVIGEVQRYWETLYAKQPVNLPAFEGLVRAHIPRGVPEEWRSVQDYTLRDLKDAVRQAVADDKAPGSNRVTAALIAELPEPVQGLLVHAYRAILRGADVPESCHEAIIWLMPKGIATGPPHRDAAKGGVGGPAARANPGCPPHCEVRRAGRLRGGVPRLVGDAEHAALDGLPLSGP